jgi:hypothetical protein
MSSNIRTFRIKENDKNLPSDHSSHYGDSGDSGECDVHEKEEYIGRIAITKNRIKQHDMRQCPVHRKAGKRSYYI